MNIQFVVTKSVGNSCLGMRKILSTEPYSTLEAAIAAIPANKVDVGCVEVEQPYYALVKVENDCVNTNMGFFQ